MTRSPVAKAEDVALTPGDLLAIESKLDLLRHRIDGWSIWPVFRFDAYWALRARETSTSFAPRATISRIQRVRFAALDALWLLLRAPRGRPVVVTNTTYLADVDDQGRRKDWLFDDICRAAGDCVKLDRLSDPASLAWRQDAAIPGVLTDSLPVMLGNLLTGRLTPAADVLAAARALSADLATVPSWRRFTVEEVARRLTVFRRTVRIWTLILRRLAPPYLLIEDGYFSHGLIAAARGLRIPVLELQHGLFFADGPEYAWPASASAYQDVMPLPDRLLVFGDHATDLLKNEGFWADRCVAVGSPRMDERRQARLRSPDEKRADEVLLLITTQGVDKPGIVAWISQLLEASAGWDRLRIVVKLHPVADHPKADYLSELPADPRLTVLAGRETPSTFDLLRQADFHASIFSTCHYEAVSLGVVTFVLPLQGHEDMQSMVAAGHAFRPSSPDEMVARMREHGANPSSEEAARHYYTEGAVQNILREINRLVSKDRP